MYTAELIFEKSENSFFLKKTVLACAEKNRKGEAIVLYCHMYLLKEKGGRVD